MHQFIQVQYLNDREGWVDDITLDELIQLQRIGYFYRPGEQRWVNIFVDPVRRRDEPHGAGDLRRRTSDRKEDDQQSETLSAQKCFERGLAALRMRCDCAGAARAFALSIQSNPMHQKAYIHRGLAYEALGNLQQAIEDYTVAILLDPDDGEAYRLRGFASRRLGMDAEAIADLRRAADLNHRPHAICLRHIHDCEWL